MIIVHAKGNSKIGIGNLSRSYELISYISRTKKVIGIFECDKSLFKRYRSTNIFQSSTLNDSLRLIEQYSCTIYISDLISPDKHLSNKLKEFGINKIIHFNGIEHGFEPDILFRTDGFDYTFEVPGIEIYRGFQYYIVGKDIKEKRKKIFTPIKSLNNILICFGGADPAFYTEYFAEIINDTTNQYTIILGPAMEKERKDYITSIKKENIKYLNSPTNMIELLLNNDLLITLGGMTTYEAMCLGVPASAVRWEYLEYNVKSFGEKNMINDLGSIKDSYENLLNLNTKQINKIAENAYNIIEGKALENIEKIINKTLKEIKLGEKID